MRRPVPGSPAAALAAVAVLAVAGDATAATARGRPPVGDRPATTVHIDLYTMDVGDEWVERFGHSAICVIHPEPDRDRCYNYGTTSFDRPAALVWGFLRGNATFWVSTQRPERMIDSYIAIDRTIWVQRLPLAPDQAARLAATLARDALPANRYYRYHHLHDNCTTRLRDFIDEVSGGALSGQGTGQSPSYRTLTRAGFAELPVLLHMSDVLIGRRLDRRPTPFQAMYLPLVLRDQVAAVLGAAPELIYQRQSRPISQEDPGRWPFAVALIVLGAPLALARALRRRGDRALIWATWPVVALGALVWGLALVSTIPELRWNEAVLVLMPLDLILVVGPRRWRRRYARGRIVELTLVSLARAVGLLAQPLWLLILLPLPALVAVATARPDTAAPATTDPVPALGPEAEAVVAQDPLPS